MEQQPGNDPSNPREEETLLPTAGSSPEPPLQATRPAAVPPPLPPPPPPPNWALPPYPPYGFGYPPPPPPPPPKKRSSLLVRLLVFFFCLVGLMVVGLFIFGEVGEGHRSVSLASHKVGILRIEGVIGQSEETNFWIESLKSFQESSTIKAVVLRIDSPGGAVGTSQEVHEMVTALRTKYGKPVMISMGDVAASGGYYIACASDRIFALRGTLTGSIGVIFSKPELSQLQDKVGIHMDTIKSGRFKDAGNPSRPFTPDEQKMFKILIDDTFEQFLSDILSTRRARIDEAANNLPAERWSELMFTTPAEKNGEALLRQVADGRVYTGQQALELGLIDSIGTLDDAINAAGMAAGLGPSPATYEPKPRRTFQEMLSSRFGSWLPRGHASLQYLMQLP